MSFDRKVKKEWAGVSQQVLGRKIMLIQKVAGWIHEAGSSIPRSLDRHLGVLRAGISMVNAVKKLESLGKDAAARMTLDSKYSVLMSVLKARNLLLEASQQLKQDCELLVPTQTLGGAADAANVNATGHADGEEHPGQSQWNEEENTRIITEIWETKTVGCFNPVLESESVMDCVCRACLQSTGKLEKTAAAILDLVGDVSGERSWKTGLPETYSLDEVVAQAGKTLMKVPDKSALKQQVATFSEDR